MRFALLPMTVVAIAVSLSACGGNKAAENNIVAEDVNAMMNLDELPSDEPAENATLETPTETPEPEPAKPAPEKPEQVPEPEPDPHAGHDMNNMQ